MSNQKQKSRRPEAGAAQENYFVTRNDSTLAQEVSQSVKPSRLDRRTKRTWRRAAR
jgi:hypothetical protein